VDIAQKEVSQDEATAMETNLVKGECELPEEGDKVLLQQDLGGRNLDDFKSEEGRILLPKDYEKFGEIAVIDIIVGIGDRFEIGGGTQNVNFANIMLGVDGHVHPIDYDIDQSGAATDATGFDTVIATAIATRYQSIQDFVYAALTDKGRGVNPSIIHDEAQIKASVRIGAQRIITHLRSLSLQQLNEIAEQGNVIVGEQYGTGVRKRIEVFISALPDL